MPNTTQSSTEHAHMNTDTLLLDHITLMSDSGSEGVRHGEGRAGACARPGLHDI